MRITIEAENGEEKKVLSKGIVLENVFEYAVVGRFMREKMFEDYFRFTRTADKDVQEGRLYETIAVIRRLK